MGAADIVPGISGGTMAFILGIYEPLIESIRKPSLKGCAFLSVLVSGIASSFLVLAKVIDSILNDPLYRVFLYSCFVGLIFASVLILSREIKKWRMRDYALLMGGVLLAYSLTHLTRTSATHFDVQIGHIETTASLINYTDGILHGVEAKEAAVMLHKGFINSETLIRMDESWIPVKQLDVLPAFQWIDPWAILCGAIAISAMLLPGISGSYLLTVLGMYAIAIGAVADLSQGDFHALFLLGNLAFGILVGALLFSHVIGWLFRYARDAALAFLTGCMLGAMQTIWPFWSTAYALNPLRLHAGPQLLPLEPILPTLNLLLIGILFAAFSFWLVFAIEHLAAKKN